MHAISLARHGAHSKRSQRREEPTHEQVTIGLPRQHINSHQCLLSVAVGEANSLRTNIASNNTYVIWSGCPATLKLRRCFCTRVVSDGPRTDAFVRGRSWAGERDLENGVLR